MCIADVSTGVVLREGIFHVYAHTIISTVRAPHSLEPLAATCLLLIYITYTSKQFEGVSEGDSGFCILVQFCHYCIVFCITFINRQLLTSGVRRDKYLLLRKNLISRQLF